jgi:hypothetical protein
MTKLTKDQKDFLAHHDIHLSLLFDASGLAPREYSEVMREDDKYFSYGVPECPRGHTLRSRAKPSRVGNCIQCNPATIAFARRHYRAADVYIAGSRAGKLLKIGLSTETDNRIYIANLDGYAGCSDWKPLVRVHVQQAGRIESTVQAKFRSYQKMIDFVRNGARQRALECFACSFRQAYTELVATLRDFAILDGKQWLAERYVLDNYEFDRL